MFAKDFRTGMARSRRFSILMGAAFGSAVLAAQVPAQVEALLWPAGAPGAKGTAAVDLMSNEKQVTAMTPPAFLFHAKDDNVVPVKNAQAYRDSLAKRGVAVELKLYEKGGHGFGLADGVGGAPNDAVLATWPGLAAAWMDEQGFFKPSATDLRRAADAVLLRQAQDRARGYGFSAETEDWGFVDAAGRTR